MVGRVAILFLGLAFGTIYKGRAEADVKHYEFTLSRSSADSERTIQGYSEINWETNKEITGRICAFKSSSENDRNTRSNLGTIQLKGVLTSPDKATIRMSYDSTQGGSNFGELIPKNEVTIGKLPEPDGTFQKISSEQSWSDLATRPVEQILQDTGVSEITFNYIPDKITSFSFNRGKKGDLYATRYSYKKRKSFEKNSDLSKFDKLTPAQALAVTAKTKLIDSTVAPGSVLVVYEPRRRTELLSYLAKFNGLAKLVATPPPDCGAPYVVDIVDVPPLLEFYFARQIQLSSLVITAYPEVYPLSPPFESITTTAGPVLSIFQSASLSIEEKSAELARFFERQVLGFARERRPRFGERWIVEPRQSGMPLSTRIQIVGATLSECVSRPEWEKIDIQFVASGLEAGAFAVGIQAVEGYAAPGSFDQRPSDDRFRDNPLRDDRLSEVQSRLVAYLLRHGFRGDLPDNAPRRPTPCPL